MRTNTHLMIWLSGFRDMRVWALRNASLGSLAVVSDAQVLSEYMCGAQCVCVCICICVCNRVLPFTTHVCDVLLCVRDRALHRIAHAHGVFGRHAHGYTRTHAHMVDTDKTTMRAPFLLVDKHRVNKFE